jgi:hypothetical protein
VVKIIPSAMLAGALLLLVALPVVGQSSSSEPSLRSLTVVALGDSWPAGGHCDGCRTFTGRFADDLAERYGTPVKFLDLAQSVVPATGKGQTPASLLDDLRSDPEVREAVASADIVVVSNGLNVLDDGSLEAFMAGTCGGADDADCFRPLGPAWESDFDAILTEIESLRGGRPTAMRLVTAENLFISDPGLVADLGAEFGMAQGKLVIDTLAETMCGAAAEHGAVCIDARTILNGPAQDQPVDEDSPESHQKIADALLASGLPELGA